MKFDDFELDGTVKIKPIELSFARRTEGRYGIDVAFDHLTIYKIHFSGKDGEGRFRFNFYYRAGFALHGVYRDEKEFEQFTKDVEKL